jgi:predicted enzyme involved in methoxymalonyl-ACP biosynthesis
VKTRYETYDEALALFGKESQLDMVVEEMAELTQAIMHARRSNRTIAHTDLCAEIADVEIMLEQLTRILDCKDEVLKQKEHKLLKLRRYITEYKNEQDN